MGWRAQLVAGAAGVTAGAVPIPSGVEGIPARALTAYVQAASGPDACPGMRWQVVAAIYRRESGHATHGGATLDAEGVASPPIYGPPVDWMGGVRAEGPGQFMPSSWQMYGAGKDPQDIDDAAVATVRHLCGTHGDLLDDHLRSAIVSYYGADQDGYADSVIEDIQMWDRLGSIAPVEGKERSPERVGGRLWNVVVSGWVRTGEASEFVRLDGVWRAADDWMFGETAPSQPAPAVDSEAEFNARLERMMAAAPGSITVYSGKRSATEQKVLWDRAQAGTGAPANWSDGVTCESKHCAGLAADLSFGPGMEAWAHDNAGSFGLVFPYGHEPWHVEAA